MTRQVNYSDVIHMLDQLEQKGLLPDADAFAFVLIKRTTDEDDPYVTVSRAFMPPDESFDMLVSATSALMELAAAVEKGEDVAVYRGGVH
jgi:hypothetical protein